MQYTKISNISPRNVIDNGENKNCGSRQQQTKYCICNHRSCLGCGLRIPSGSHKFESSRKKNNKKYYSTQTKKGRKKILENTF